jgi:hypothetical protein
MQIVLIVALVLHVLAAVFWAGSTFTLARLGGERAEKLFGPQMGAATLAIITGMYLWSVLHSGEFGVAEQILSVGVISALIAAGVQGALIGGARRRIAAGTDPSALQGRMAVAEQIAAVLLAITLIAMTVVRFI